MKQLTQTETVTQREFLRDYNILYLVKKDNDIYLL